MLAFAMLTLISLPFSRLAMRSRLGIKHAQEGTGTLTAMAAASAARTHSWED